jgi:hypothetical protein
VNVSPGAIIFVRNAGVGPALIRFGETRRYGRARGPGDPAYWNHVAVCVAPGEVIEARPTGVVPWKLDQEQGWVAWAAWMPPYGPSGAAACVAAMQELAVDGEGYGWVGIASEVLMFATGSRLRFGLQGTALCSGAAAYALTRADIDMGTDEEWDSPATVYALGPGRGGWTLERQMPA